MSLRGVRPKSVAMVTVPLFRFPISLSEKDGQICLKLLLPRVSHLPLVAAIIDRFVTYFCTINGCKDWHTRCRLFNQFLNLRNRNQLVLSSSVSLAHEKLTHFEHFVVQLIENVAQELFGVFLTPFHVYSGAVPQLVNGCRLKRRITY